MDNKLKKTIPLALAAALGFAPVLQVAQAQGSAAVQAGGALSQSGATRVAKELGLTLGDAISKGYIAPGSATGTYVVTQPGAKAILAGKGLLASSTAGGAGLAGLSTLQLTLLAAGAIGVAVIAASDEDAPLAAPSPTPTATPTPTPVITPTPSPTGGTPTTGQTGTTTTTSSSTTGSTSR